jgi:hypothetical protein
MELNIQELNDKNYFEEIPENNINQNDYFDTLKDISKKPKISYEDILSNMGMLVSNGKLHLVDRNTYNQQKPTTQQNVEQSGYIYNKYFKEETQQPTIRKPKTIQEYKEMVIKDYIAKCKIKQIKSTKLIMPSTNIHYSQNTANLNMLFNYPKKV